MKYLLALLLFAGCASNAKKEDTPSYLFVQNAQQAKLADGRLSLEGVSPRSVVFSDRPDRSAGHITNTNLLRAWDGKDAAFSKDPPNATLSVFEKDTAIDVVVVLRNPTREGTTLSYEVKVLAGPATLAGGPAVLFIDNLAPWPVVREGMHDEPNVVVRDGMHLTGNSGR
jgi:hypothetical protein